MAQGVGWVQSNVVRRFSISSIAAEIVSSEGAASSVLRGRLRRGDFCRAVGISAVGAANAAPLANFEGSEVDVEILSFGPCFEVVVFCWPASGGVARPAEPGRAGMGDSARARCDVMALCLREGADAMGRGPPVRPVPLLPMEFTLALSSSCCRLLLIEEES